jgi:translation initiation factor 2 subunit 1
MYLREGLPEVGDFVIGTVSKVSQHKIVLTLDEYKQLRGTLYTSEMHRKQVRTMRVLFKSGRKFVCKVVSSDKTGIDLSLRKVGAGQERTKEEEFKNEKIADGIILQLAKSTNTKYETLFKKIGIPILKKYNLIYPFFEEVLRDESIVKQLKIDKSTNENLVKTILKRIKPKNSILKLNVLMESNESNGLEKIKRSITDSIKFIKKEGGKLTVKYIGAPKYRFILEHENGKTAQKLVINMEARLNKYLKNGSLTIKEIK